MQQISHQKRQTKSVSQHNRQPQPSLPPNSAQPTLLSEETCEEIEDRLREINRRIKEAHSTSSPKRLAPILVSLLFVLAAALVVRYGPEFAAFVTYEQAFNETLRISTPHNLTLNLQLQHRPSSLRLSGTFTGTGSATAYLLQNGTRLLVALVSVQSTAQQNSVTGMAEADLLENRPPAPENHTGASVHNTSFPAVENETQHNISSAANSTSAKEPTEGMAQQITFQDVCTETCSLTGISQNITLLLQVHNGTLNLTKLSYTVTQKQPESSKASNACRPFWNSSTESFDASRPLTINLSQYFVDPSGASLTYLAVGAEGVNITLQGELCTIATSGPVAVNITLFASNLNFTVSKQITIVSGATNPEEALNKSAQNETFSEFLKPVWNSQVQALQLRGGLRLNLYDYLSSPTKANLTFAFRPVQNITITLNTNFLTLLPARKLVANRTLTLFASNGLSQASKEIVLLVDTTENNTTSNQTVSNASLTSNQSAPILEGLIQGPAEIGKPVHWTKWVRHNTTRVELPEEAQNITVSSFVGMKKTKVSDKQLKRGIAKKGLKAASAEPTLPLEINLSADSLEITYETNAPTATVQALGPQATRIVISSPLHYSNVLSFVDIGDVQPAAIRLYSVSNSSKTDITSDPAYNVTLLDLNNNSLVDRVRWITPHLSNQTFEISITILNVQSYPMVGGNWTVAFNTTGIANLTIFAANGTTYGNSSPHDLQFLSLKCGNVSFSSFFNGSRVFVENYECNTTALHTVGVLTTGRHTQAFRFGDQTEYAHNWAGWINVSLRSPPTGTVLTQNNVTLRCNVTLNSTTRYLKNVSLYLNSSNGLKFNRSVIFGPINASGSLGSKLLFLYHLNNDSSLGESQTKFNDSSGFKNNGTCPVGNCPNVVAGKFGKARKFNGTTQVISGGTKNSLTNLRRWTIAAWIYPTSIIPGHDYIVAKADVAQNGYWLEGTSSSNLFFVEMDWTSGSTFQYSTANSFATSDLNHWMHIAATWNGSSTAGSWRIYKNGVDITDYYTAGTIGAQCNDVNCQILIGNSDPGRLDHPFNGTIDEVAIWNRTLSATEIKGLWNLTRTRYQANFTLPNLRNRTYKWNCLAADNNSFSRWAVANWTFKYALRHNPTITSGPTLSPSLPNVTSRLNCSFKIGDIDVGDTLYANYTWYNKTGSTWTAKFKGRISVTNNTYASIRLTGGTNLTKARNWNCSIKAYDGTNYSTAKSVNVTIKNWPARRDAQFLTPSTAYKGTKLSGNATCVDLDPTDSISAWCQLYNTTAIFASRYTRTVTNNTKTNICNVTASQTKKGQTWKAEFWCGDGTANSTKTNATNTILNTPPYFVTNPSISPTSPNTSSRLNCSFKIGDIDVGDTLYANYTWYNKTGSSWTAKFKGRISVTNNTYASIRLTGTTNLTKGRNWNCTIQPYDLTDYGTIKSVNVTIKNWPSRRENQWLTPSTAYTGTKLTGNATCVDLDTADTITAWCQLYNTTAIFGTKYKRTVTNNTKTNICNVTSSQTKKGKTWYAEFWCGDSTFNCTKANLSVTILNSLPSFAKSPALSPKPVYGRQKLGCNFSISDIDAEPNLYANFTWYNWTGTSWAAKFKGQRSVLNNTLFWLNLSALNVSNGNKWNCSILPYDGTGYGSWKSDNVTVQQTPLTYLRSPATGSVIPDTNVTLRCNASSFGSTALQNISLWTNKTGTWSGNKTIDVREIQPGDSKLILLLHFNNDSSDGENGTFFYDSSGKGRKGSCTGNACPSFNRTGKIRGAMNFDGSNDYIATPDQDDYRGNLTITAWVNAKNGTYGYIVNKNYDGSNVPFSLNVGGNSAPSMVNGLAVYSPGWTCSGINTDIRGTGWRFVAGRYNGSALCYFVDGVQDSCSAMSGALPKNDNTVDIGRYAYDGQYFSGTIDEVAIWNRSLTSTEIRNLYNLTRRKFQANFSLTGLSTGNYKWNCLAYDNASQSRWAASNWTFGMDLRPTTMLRSPATGMTITDTNVTLRCNATDDIALKNISLYTNRSSSWVRNKTIDVREIQPSSRKLAVLYHFNNDSSVGENQTRIYDWSGNGIYGVVTGGIGYNASGKIKSGYQLDGVDGTEIKMSGLPISTAAGDNITVAFWMYWFGTGGQMPFGWKDGYYDLYLAYSFFGFNTGGGDVYGVSTAGPLLDHKWAHIVAVFPNSYPTAEPALYINGNKQSLSLLFGTRYARSVMTSALISGWTDGAGYKFAGVVDEFAIWNRTLTNAEISALYNLTRKKFQANFSLTGLPILSYKWNCLAYDNASQGKWATSNWTFRKGAEIPGIKFVSPTPASGYATSLNYTYLNTSIRSNTNTSAFFDWNRTLVGYWSFEYYNSTGVLDNSSYKNFGAFQGGLSTGKTTPGKFGNGMAFDGAGNYIDAGNNSILNHFGSGGITLSAWVKLRGQPNANFPTIFEKSSGDFTNVPSNQKGIYLSVGYVGNPVNYMRWGLGDGSGYDFVDYYIYNADLLNIWHHVVAVADDASSSSPQLRLYVDGILKGSTSRTHTGSIDITTKDLSIGNWKQYSRFFNGTIDELRIWRRALSAEEINASYNSGKYRLFHNFTSLGVGNYTYSAWAINTEGGVNRTATRTFKRTAEVPGIKFVSPTPASGNVTSRTYAYLNTSIRSNTNTSAFFDWNRTLVGYWSFDYYNSSGVYDNSSYHNFGKFQGGLGTSNLTAGKYGKGLKLDGLDDYVDVGSNPSLLPDIFTVMAWFKVSDSDYNPIVAFAAGIPALYVDFPFVPNKALIYLGGDSYRYFNHDINVDDGTWHHVAFVITGNGQSDIDNSKMYVDGVSQTIYGTDDGGLPAAKSTVRIGGSTWYFNGAIDEVRIFKRALSPEEVNASYNAGRYRLYHNFTGLGVGNYTYSAWAINTEGGVNRTATRTFKRTAEIPGIKFVSPTPPSGNVTSRTYAYLNTSIRSNTNTSAFFDWNRTLAGYWSFDYYNTTGVFDNSSYRNFGAFEGSLKTSNITTGKYGKGLLFDGVSADVNLGQPSSLKNLNAPMTISAWIKPHGLSANEDTILGKVFDWQLEYDISRVVGFRRWSSYQGVYSSSTLNLDQWAYITVTLSSDASNNLLIYINGKLDKTGTIATPLNTNSYDTKISGNVQADIDYFNGTIDEVRIWKRVLSAEEVNASYNAGKYRLYHNFTGLGVGNYTYAAWAINTEGGMNRTATRTFKRTAEIPGIKFVSPTPASGNVTSRTYAYLNTSIRSNTNTSAFFDWNRTLVGYFSFDYYNTTGVFDNSSYRNFGKFYGGLSTSNITNGKYGKGLKFDGVDDYVDLGNDGHLNSIAKALTVEGWVYSRETSSYQYIASNDRDCCGTYNGYSLRISNGNGQFIIWNTNVHFTTTTRTVSLNTWHHIAGTFNGTHLIAYLDGTSDGTTAWTGTIGTPASFNLAIGGLGAFPGIYNINGTIDEVRIYSRALSAQEINASYNAGKYRLYHNFTGLGVGNYTYSAWAINTEGGVNRTATRTFKRTAEIPGIKFVSPTSASGYATSLNYTYLNTSIRSNTNTSAFFDWNRTLAGYWSFDYYNSSGVYDNSSYRHFGTFQGGLGTSNITTGKYGKGLVFDGANAYLNVGTISLLDIAGDITISTWIKFNSKGVNNGIVSKFNAYNKGYLLTVSGSVGIIRFSRYNSVTSEDLDIPAAINDGQWHYLAATYDSLSGHRIYVDGVQVAYASKIFQADPPTAAGFQIGTRTDANKFNGTIDEVRVFSRALSAQEVNASYNAGRYRLFHSFTGLGVGNYTYSAWAINTEGGVNRTATRTFKRTAEVPGIKFVSPTPPSGNVTSRTYAYLNTSIRSNTNTSAFFDWNRTLVGYWSFDYYNTTGVFDNSSYRNFGAFHGTGFGTSNITTGRYGKALKFDGLADYVDSGVDLSWNNLNSVSISFWVKPNTVVTGTPGIIGKLYPNWEWSIYQSNAAVELVYWDTSGSNSNGMDFGTSSVFSAGQWTNIVYTWNGSSSKFYANGVLKATHAATDPTKNQDRANNAQIGGHIYTWGDTYFNGSLDEVRFFRRTLSPEEVNASYNSGKYRLFHNFTDLGVGNYTYSAWAINTEGGVNRTSTRTFSVVPGSLNVSISGPANNTGVARYNTLTLNGTIKCRSDASAACGNVSGFGRYNKSSLTANTVISKASSAKPVTYMESPFVEWGKTDAIGLVSDAVAVDSQDNIIVTGLGNSYHYLTVKYNSNGGLLWNSTSVSGGYNAVAVDSKDNIIASGQYSYHYLTVKRNSSGGLLWNRTYAAGFSATSVAVDSQDNIIVTGEENEKNPDYLTVKYNSSGGLLWNKIDATGYSATGVAVDSQDNIIITGGDNKAHYRTVKYNTSGGLLWNRTYAAGSQANGVAVDSKDNIIITGNDGNGHYRTVKYNSSGGLLWNRTDAAGYGAYGVAVDSLDNIVASGRNGYDANAHFRTVKYNSSGALLWNITDAVGYTGFGVAVDSQDNIIVTGNVWNNNYFRTVKYYVGTNPKRYGWLGANGQKSLLLNLNATGNNGQCFYVDVFANSSYGNTLVKSKNSSDRRICIGGFNATVKLVSPSNSATVPYVNITFVCNASSLAGVRNISLYTNQSGSWKINQSLKLAAQPLVYLANFTVNLRVGNYKWNCLAFDNMSRTDIGDVNWTVRRNPEVPGIKFVSPTPANGTVTSQNYAYLNTSIRSVTNTSAFFDWNRTLAGYWSFDYYNTTGVFDNSSYKNFGTFQGGLGTSNITTGKYGKALKFDGKDDYVDLGGNILNANNNLYSISAWFKKNGASDSAIICKDENTTFVQYYVGWYGNHFRFYYSPSYHSSPSINYPSWDNIDDSWHNVVVGWNGTTVYLYADGVLVNSAAVSTSHAYTEPRNSIGRYGGYNGYYFNGTIDEVRIYSRALSPQEVNASYNAGKHRLFHNFTGLGVANYTYAAWAINTEGGVNRTATRTFKKVAEVPGIKFVSPTPASGNTTTNKYVYVNTSIRSVTNTSAFFDWNRTLVGYWSFDYYNATGVFDNSSYKNFGTFNGGLGTNNITTGKYGKALKFDGTDDYVAATNSMSISMASFSTSAWFKTTSSSDAKIVSNNISYHQLQIINGHLRICVNSCTEGTIAINDGNWHFAVVVGDSTSIRAYLDGKSTPEITQTATTGTMNGIVNIGRTGGSSSYYFPGLIDEVRIYKRALSPEEINASYNAGKYRLYKNFTGLGSNTYTYAAWAINTEGGINRTATRNITTGTNSPPTVSSGPTLPSYTGCNAKLVCAFTITDPDAGDTLYGNFTWYNKTGSSWTKKFKGRVGVTNNVQYQVNLSASNTTCKDTWNCSIRPYDSTVYGTEKSAKVYINNTPPPKTNLSYPPRNNSFFSDRTPRFNWTAITDPDGDSVTYKFQLATDHGFSLMVNTTKTSVNKVNYTKQLVISTMYFWRVQVNDSMNVSPWSNVWNFTVQPYIALAIFNKSMQFGNMMPNAADNTTDGSPPPFKLRNDGNIEANVSIAGSALWTSQPMGKKYYQYKARATGEANSFNATGSKTTWMNMTASNATIIKRLNHTDIHDEAFVDIRVQVPPSEPPTTRSSWVYFWYQDGR